MNRNSPTLISFLVLSVFAGFQFGCNRPNRQNTPTKIDEQPYTPPSVPRIEHVEVELPVESMINYAVALNQKNLAEAQRAGKSNTVGAMNGTEWLKLDILSQAMFVRGLGDLIEFMNDVSSVSTSALRREKEAKVLEYESGNTSFTTAYYGMTGAYRSRVLDVIGGRSFRDLTSAITEFYQRKPLLKDKPVLWVLAVPLYREIQESRSKPQPFSVDEAIEQRKDKVAVTMVKKK